MNRHERLSQLASLVIERGFVRVEDIQEELGISAATARRDLDVLASQQLITRTRGGATANTSSGELPLRYRAARKGEEKQRIAVAASGLVRPGQVVALNGGTTTTAVAMELGIQSAAHQGFSEHPLTVVTNAVNIAADLTVREGVRVVCTGGVARSQSYELIGPLAELILPRISIDIAFLGVSGIVAGEGVFTRSDSEATINALFGRGAREVVVVADSSKLGVFAFAKILDAPEVHVLITDSGADPEQVHALEESGTKVLVV